MSGVAPSRAPDAGGFAKWGIVALLWGAYFLNQADRQIFGVTLPLIRDHFQLTDEEMGLVATTFSIVFGILVPIAGIAGDRLRRPTVVIFSLLVFSFGTLLTGFAGSFLMLLLFRGVATGAGEAFYQPAASALIAERHVATRARALSIHQTANYLGVVFGSLFAGWVAQRHGWQAAFALFGSLGIAWAIVIYFATRRSPAPERSRAPIFANFGEAIATIGRDPLLIGQTVGFAALVFVLVGYLTWMPTILYERFDLSLADAGFSSVAYHHALAAVGLLIGSTITDHFTPRMPRFRVTLMALSLIACGPMLWIVADTSSLILLYFGLAAFGLFRGLYDANLFAGIFDFVDDRLRATVVGIIVAVAYLVGAISPVAMGWLKPHYGITSSLQLLAATSVVSGLVFLALIWSAKLRPRGRAAPQ